MRSSRDCDRCPSQRLLECDDVHRVAALVRHQLREIDREAEGVVEAECIRAADRAPNPRRALRGVQWRELIEAQHPLLDRRQKALLFRARGVDDERAPLPELRIHALHLVDDDAHELVERRLAAAEEPRVPHSAPENAAQHVAATLVRRKDTIRDEKGDRARVIGEHAKGHRVVCHHPVTRPVAPRATPRFRCPRPADRRTTCRAPPRPSRSAGRRDRCGSCS